MSWEEHNAMEPTRPKAPDEWQYGYHRDQDGKLHKISEMGDNYLLNLLGWAEKKQVHPNDRKPIRLECEYRGLKYKKFLANELEEDTTNLNLE